MLDATCPPDQGRQRILELWCPLLHGQALENLECQSRAGVSPQDQVWQISCHLLWASQYKINLSKPWDPFVRQI